MKKQLTLTEIENTLHHLNYRWNLEALALWKGDKAPFKPYRLYESYENFVSLDTLSQIDQLRDGVGRGRLRHALIDHYLQRAVLPHENEMRAWMQGAAGYVNGRKIFFRDIIPWCQKSSTYEERKILEKEVGPLCKFLRPFALNYWEILLKILVEELGFHDYIDYCQQKKGIDYGYYYDLLKDILHRTDGLYFPAMDRWSLKTLGHPLKSLSRFDGINLLGLGEFDPLCPRRSMAELVEWFGYLDMDLGSLSGLTLDLEAKDKKSGQAVCFVLQAPEEVYVLMKPEGGWIDLESLWHELGHGLSAVFTSPDLSIVDRDMATDYSLSEAFAFLLQNVTMSLPFLTDYLGLRPADAENLVYYKRLKDLSVFRRYAAKFLAEYEMFTRGDLSDGNGYSERMARYTGFYYQPESHLFDLVSEFYSLDYVVGWMAEAIMDGYFRDTLGSHWMFKPEAGRILKDWWAEGNRYDTAEFLKRCGLGDLGPEAVLRRWEDLL